MEGGYDRTVQIPGGVSQTSWLRYVLHHSREYDNGFEFQEGLENLLNNKNNLKTNYLYELSEML